ncbi:MAG: OmpA family protein [Haliscomenobacter sp.]|uniref:OmpA family protein n=1 Tax=Haliscomenobacter sp. TaxID=2717303 RepID=UPI0029A4A791|nr:OmpA family protein [Haliscomenobacter sp.]MDX2070254.1 OmpA family protein [Haliscomenobacter sp.]
MKPHYRLFSISLCVFALLFISVACKNQVEKEPVSAEEDPMGAIEDMLDETKALAKEEAAQVDEETLKRLESLRQEHFAEGTVGEKLYQAIDAGKDLSIEVFLFKTLNFQVDKADVLPAMQVELQQLAKILKAFPRFKIEIGAHTEGAGDPILNLTLSQDRASAVVDFLSKMGIAKSRMKATGYGDEFPVADVEMMEGRMANERVELTFLKK